MLKFKIYCSSLFFKLSQHFWGLFKVVIFFFLIQFPNERSSWNQPHEVSCYLNIFVVSLFLLSNVGRSDRDENVCSSYNFCATFDLRSATMSNQIHVQKDLPSLLVQRLLQAWKHFPLQTNKDNFQQPSLPNSNLRKFYQLLSLKSSMFRGNRYQAFDKFCSWVKKTKVDIDKCIRWHSVPLCGS